MRFVTTRARLCSRNKRVTWRVEPYLDTAASALPAVWGGRFFTTGGPMPRHMKHSASDAR
jgi:hypothetical protein